MGHCPQLTDLARVAPASFNQKVSDLKCIQSNNNLTINTMQFSSIVEDYFKGEFVINSTALRQKFRTIKAFVFDWDGVFNNGQKNIDGHSTFSEVDSMGINLIRFNHHLLNKKIPISAIISGENNQLAFSYARRENFNSIYYKVAHKEKAILHLCKQHNISPAEVMFVFDDVLDLSVARLVGVRMMVNRDANPLLIEYAKNNRLVDYVTYFDGSNNALRELSEMIMVMTNNYETTIDHRIKFSEPYQAYLNIKNQIPTLSYTLLDNEITQA